MNHHDSEGSDLKQNMDPTENVGSPLERHSKKSRNRDHVHSTVTLALVTHFFLRQECQENEAQG